MIVSHTRLAHWLKILDPKKQQNQHGLIIRIQIATVHNVAKFIGQLLPSSAIMTTEHAKAGAFNGTTDTCDVSGSINMCVYIYCIYYITIFCPMDPSKNLDFIHPISEMILQFKCPFDDGDFPASHGWGSDRSIRQNWHRSIQQK